MYDEYRIQNSEYLLLASTYSYIHKEMSLRAIAWQSHFLIKRLPQVLDPQIIRGGRQRAWFLARAMLVLLGREWSGMRTKELEEKFHRDPSVISRLYRRYAERRDTRIEERLSSVLKS